jgi:hypothetical protein
LDDVQVVPEARPLGELAGEEQLLERQRRDGIPRGNDRHQLLLHPQVRLAMLGRQARQLLLLEGRVGLELSVRGLIALRVRPLVVPRVDVVGVAGDLGATH